MNKEDYVSYKCAKLLKEKNYNEFCDALYFKGHLKFIKNYNYLDILNKNFYSAPLQYKVRKWLRDKYNIHIIIETDYNGKYSYKCCSSPEEQLKIEYERLSKNDHYIFNSYEEALSEAIYESLNKI